MQPNKYQISVIEDLRSFLTRWRLCNDASLAYREHWDNKGVAKMPPYNNASHGVPQVCAKVPTAGGKTLIGILAIKEILDALERRRGEPRMCVWLVPSKTIRSQVLKGFSTAGDSYWLTLRETLGGSVSVLSKEQMLEGGGLFNADLVRNDVVISVVVYDSLRATNKDDRKMYQENAALISFQADVLDSQTESDVEPESLIAAIASLNPIVVVDESHNATSDLSKDMLARLNPCCVFELTATPRTGANIISYVDAMALRDEHMVKLPVIVRNLPDQSSVIAHAIDLQKRLEAEAVSELNSGGKYIRPIVLFQAEPKNKDDSLTFEKLRKKLVDDYGLDPEQIKIKTANFDELTKIDLMDATCQVRFIITVNALKEGWDCPFAYILATLADRSSAIDVEQILGRILRQPYIREHGNAPLNMSYVLTASAVFTQTLERIVAGLNRAGFSRNDFRTPDALPIEVVTITPENPSKTPELFNVINLIDGESPTRQTEIDAHPAFTNQVTLELSAVDVTLKCGEIANEELKSASEKLGVSYIPPDLAEKMNIFPIRHNFADEVRTLRLPQFYRKVDEHSLFAEIQGGTLLDRDMLLEKFQLANCNVNDFGFDITTGDIAKLDLVSLETEGTNYEPTRVQLKPNDINKLREILATLSSDAKKRQLSGLVSSWLGKMPPLGEPDLREYINKLLSRLSPHELDGIVEQQQLFIDAVRKRVRQEMLNFRRETFLQWVSTEEIFAKGTYFFSQESNLIELYTPCENTLYEREESSKLTDIERKMADWLSSSSNIQWWHRNHQTQGFCLNGAINHYPDFIVKTKNGKIVLIETKGAPYKGDDSIAKIELGQNWEKCVGREYRYIMVFDTNPLPNAYSWQDALNILNRV